MQAAGGLVSTAADLAKWLEVQINEGKLDGKQVFPRTVMAETQRLHASTPAANRNPQMVGYTLGWMVAVLDGDTVLHHGGGFSSFGTYLAFSPKQKTGVAVVVNEAGTGRGAVEFIRDYVLDRARGAPGWQQKYEQQLAQMPEKVQQLRSRIAEDRQRRAARPQVLPNPLTAYAGAYDSPVGGTMVWTVREDRLWAQIGLLKSVAEVFDGGTNRLRVELEPGQGEVVQFNFEDGKAVSLTYSDREYRRVHRAE